MILEETGLSEKMQGADLVITGEGRLDEQSAMGKAPIGVAKLAKEQGIPVIAFAGAVTEGAKACNQAGIDAYFPILREIITLEDAMKKKLPSRTWQIVWNRRYVSSAYSIKSNRKIKIKFLSNIGLNLGHALASLALCSEGLRSL